MIASVIEDQRDGYPRIECLDFVEQGADGDGIDIGRIGDGDDFFADGVDRAEDIESLPAAGGSDPDSSDTP